jgi:hypothetical protein
LVKLIKTNLGDYSRTEMLGLPEQRKYGKYNFWKLQNLLKKGLTVLRHPMKQRDSKSPAKNFR